MRIPNVRYYNKLIKEVILGLWKGLGMLPWEDYVGELLYCTVQILGDL